MPQIYLLNVLSLFLAGACLGRRILADKFEGFKLFAEAFEGKTFQLVLSILTLLSGLVTLFTFGPGDPVILGDLLPASTAIVAGLLLLGDYMYDSDSDSAGTLNVLADFNQKYGGIAGIGAMAIALIHALFPMAIIL